VRLKSLAWLALIVALLLLARATDVDAWLERAIGGEGALHGLALLRAALVLAAATLVSEDLTCLAAGALVGDGRLPFLVAAGACFAGILIGDVLLFLCGRWLGPDVLTRAPCNWFLDARRVAEARAWLERRGAVVILLSRFLPGARLPTYFASGALGTSLARFTAWFALAGLLWTPAVVALAAGLVGGLGSVGALRARGGLGLALGLVAGWLLLALVRQLVTARGRGLLRARARRLVRFEYWPVAVFYLPVFVLFALRALRGRALDFTAANPALPHGGFVGESKRAIYALLAAAEAPLPRTLCLEARLAPAARRARVAEFRRAHGLTLPNPLPIVVKPDAGQRGEGVRVVRDEAALEAALAADEALVVQEFVPGAEFGLFYARRPGASAGELLSITRKLLPHVVGDGTRTLERLILTSREHLPMAPFFLARPAAELARVPAAGERVALGELGTHCRGARFHDGAALASPELAAALERIVRALPGFHLGRFDVRADDDEALRAGRFTILELNGVTSEAAHVYDPRHGLATAWRSLLSQWRLAYAIGRANAAAGARVSTLAELVAALREYRALAARRVEPAAVDRATPVEGKALESTP
jgi:membrane protein DedA with SNARE-associated domain